MQRALRIVAALALAGGVLLLAWPVAVQWKGAYEAARAVVSAQVAIDGVSKDERARLLEDAARYNEALANARVEAADGGVDSFARDDYADYASQLSAAGLDMAAYIEVPKIGVRLPIYHGADESSLLAGVGHLEGSSLPVGGESTHCVLTAHTGSSDASMFDDIDQLLPGDVFMLWTLGQPFSYCVTGAETVLPTQVDSLSITPGADECTLVTCTPPGVNTHRLLVHATRCAYDPGDGSASSVAAFVNGRTAPFLLAIVIVVVAAVGIFLRFRSVPFKPGRPRSR